MTIRKPQMTDAQELAIAIYMVNMYFYQKMDRAGQPAILHSMRVMLKGKTVVEQTVGMLHDSEEDTAITHRDLRAWGFSDVVLDAVDCLTRRPDETYAVYLERVKAGGDLPIRVKILDLTDNIERPRPLGEDEETGMKKRSKHIRHRAELEAYQGRMF